MKVTLIKVSALLSVAAIGAASLALPIGSTTESETQTQSEPIGDHSTNAQGITALLITDPQNDFLREDGAAHALVSENLKANDTINNIERLFKSAQSTKLPVFVSPHMYHQHDEGWEQRGTLQKTIHEIDMYKVKDAYYRTGLEGSGADFFERYKSYILDGHTVITSPHKVFGPESNDLVLQLRKRGIQRVLIGGLAGNLCTEGHMRELVEQGFEVVMINDAVGSPGQAAHDAAMLNYSLIAHEVLTTKQAIDRYIR